MAADSRRVVRYDGQTILLEGEGGYELGAYLGGGASGVVYEANYVGSKQRVAVKILHPLGFKAVRGGFDRYTEITEPREDVRWFVHPQTKDVVVTGKDGKELTLLKCIEIFGMHLPKEDLTDAQVLEAVRQGRRKGVFPPKFAKFLRQRALIFREISSMRRVSGHRNVLRLDDVLELIQESKLTFFLVLELASGGELFDRITADEGCDEEVACNYMRQVLDGVMYCHSKGVCHRDLKPENLLLTHDGNTLKIADFGLSTNMVHDPVGATPGAAITSHTLKLNGSDPLRRLVSVVGSCHYIAPEVLNKQAYDGTKADAWSIGVILYALLNGSLPFGKDLLTCPRFLTFSKTLKETSSNDGRRFFCGDFESVNKLRGDLDWFIPEKLSNESVVLIIGLLNPDPVERYTIKRALADVWFRRGRKDHLEDSIAPHNILLDARDEDELDERMLLDGDDDAMDVDDDGVEEDDMFEIDVPKPTSFIPTPSKQIKASPPGNGNQGTNRHLAAAMRDSEMDMARSAPVARHMGGGGGAASAMPVGSMAFSFTSPPLAPRQSLSPPVVIGSGSGATTPFNDNDASSEEGGASYRRDSGLSSSMSTRKSIVRRTSASFKPAGGFRSRSSSPTRRMTGAAVSGDTEAPIFHAAMKRSTVFTTCVPANQVLERLSKTVTELGGLSSRIDWERFQIEITQDETSLQLCVVQVFLSRERPGPVYIVEFVRGPEFEIFAFKAFYTEVMHHLASIVRADHMHTMRY